MMHLRDLTCTCFLMYLHEIIWMTTTNTKPSVVSPSSPRIYEKLYAGLLPGDAAIFRFNLRGVLLYHHRT
jgi:hypothetical protein